MIASQETDDDSIAHQETVIHDEDEIKKSPAAKLSTLFKQLVFRQKSSTTDPRTWPRSKKIPIVIIVALAGATSPVASTIYYPALVDMQLYFQTSDTAMNASLAVYTYFLAFFPLIWATFGDLFGRRPIYLVSFLIAVAGIICCSFSTNVAMFIVFRAISAAGSSSVLSMGAGTISDIFDSHERGRAFSYYMMGPLLGPVLGPIIGGYLNRAFGWQSIFYFMACLSFCAWLGVLIFLPETHYIEPTKPTLRASETDTQQMKTKTSRFINPIAALGLLRHVNIALSVPFLGVLFFIFYLLSTNFTRTYTIQYGFDSGQVGLYYLPNAIGNILGGLVGGRFSDRVYNKKVGKLPPEQPPFPELRIGGIILWGSLVIQFLALTAYGWCIQKNVHFAYGLIALFFAGAGLGAPNIILSTYIVDCFRNRSASVTACNNFTRYILAGIGSLVASDMERAMGPGILYTFCGALLILFSSGFIYVRLHGKRWSEKKHMDNSNTACA
ncbi:hypothetical protein VTP01DRAFT_8716 [Rhizomucor pusillus]|uniref:uncharacterized protein n=1 Tax=Rhizomucor pusillus TaxID=4840 RepID=UPI003742241E